MLIVLEGCDGSGKSTLAKKLAMVSDADIIHCSAETPNDYEFFHNIISGSINKNIIADRFCYGQFVYQDAEERNLTTTELYRLESDMVNVGTKVIFVDADSDTIYDRLIRRGEATLKPIQEIRQGFVDVFTNSLIKPILWKT